MEDFEPRREGESLEDYAKRLEAEIAKLQKNKTRYTVDKPLEVVPEGTNSKGVNVKYTNTLENTFGGDIFEKMANFQSFEDWLETIGRTAAYNEATDRIKDLMAEKGATGDIKDSAVWTKRRDKLIDGYIEKFANAYKRYNRAAELADKEERSKKARETATKRFEELGRGESSRKAGEITHKDDKWFNEDGRYQRTNAASKKRSYMEGAEKALQHYNELFDEAGMEDVRRNIEQVASSFGKSNMKAEDWQKLLSDSDESFVIYENAIDRKKHNLTVRRGTSGVWQLVGPEEIQTFLDTVPTNKIDASPLEKKSDPKFFNNLKRMLSTGDQDWYYGDKKEEKNYSKPQDGLIERYLAGEDMSDEWTWEDRDLADNILKQMDTLYNEFNNLNSAYNNEQDPRKKDELRTALYDKQDEILNLKDQLPEKLDIKERIVRKQLGIESDEALDKLLNNASEEDFKDYLRARKIIADNATSETDAIDIASKLKNRLSKLRKNPELRETVSRAEEKLLPLVEQMVSVEDGEGAKHWRSRISDFINNISELGESDNDVAAVVDGLDFKYDLSGSDGLKDIAMNITAMTDMGLTPNQQEWIKTVHNPDIEAGMRKNRYIRKGNAYKGKPRSLDRAQTQQAQWEQEAEYTPTEEELKKLKADAAARKTAMANAEAKKAKKVKKIAEERSADAKANEKRNAMESKADKNIDTRGKPESTEIIPANFSSVEEYMKAKAAQEAQDAKDANLKPGNIPADYPDMSDNLGNKTDKKDYLGSKQLKPIIDALNNKW